MQIIEHTTIVKPNSMTLEVTPLIVWLDKYTELRIEKGDSVKTVAKQIRKFWLDLSYADACQLVTFWFALGQRAKSGDSGPWSSTELQPDAARRYLKRV